MSEMWSTFLDSWSLWGQSYETALLVGALLALCGVFVVAQRQVFLGVAVTQASQLGIAAALVVLGALANGQHHAQHGIPVLVSVVFAIGASLATTRGLHGRAEADSVGAWIFLVGSSGSVLLLAHSPHGLEEVQRLTFSSLIGADEHDVMTFAGLLVVSAALIAWRRRDALLASTDPVTAHALGRPVRAWQLGIAVWIGLSIGTAQHATGSLFAFASLALPALAARELCRTMAGMLIVAPMVAVVTTFASLFVAHVVDFPPGQVATAMLALVALVARIVHAARIV